jgi:ribonuclease-3
MYPLSIESLEKRIKYSFKNKNLIITALTHSSFAYEQKAHKKEFECNERLEFLGDSVLSLVVSDYLFSQYNNKAEGELTKIRASLVCTRSLSNFANKISLGDYLFLGKGEASSGRTNVKILENAFEALLAAIYLDSQGKEEVAKFLIPMIKEELSLVGTNVNYDYKTSLQQFVQALGNDRIQYVCVNEEGPDHDKTFEVTVKINSNIVGTGKGKTKREAEQNAAKEALKLFDVK